MEKVDGRHRGHKPTKEMKQAIKNIGLGKSKEQREFERIALTEAFLRPPYQYTSQVNDTIERLHENDWLKKKSIYER